MGRVTYYRLSPAARETIRNWWPVAGGRPPSIAGYVRHWFRDGQWGGDECGCTDDRCIGYHHDEHEDCGCLPVLLDEYLDSARPAPGTHPDSAVTRQR